MTNALTSFSFNGVQIDAVSGVRLVRLFQTAVGTLTFHDSLDGNDYQVPVGKKFKIIFIESSAFAGTDRIISSTVVDSTTGEVILMQPNATLNNVIFVTAEVAAGLFITKVDAGAGTYIVWGIEEDV